MKPKPSPEEKAARKASKRAEYAAVQQREALKEQESEKALAQQYRESRTGRPSKYEPVLADEICAWVAEGKSLRSWCRQHDITLPTVYAWMREDKSFFARYTRACEDRADSLADDLLDIADESQYGSMEAIQAAKLRIETRKWIAAKLRPQKWGDYQPIEQRSNVTFNIGISRVPHSVGHTIDATPLISQGSAPDK